MSDKQMRNAIDRRQKAFDTLLLSVFKHIQVLHDPTKLILIVYPPISVWMCHKNVRLFQIYNYIFSSLSAGNDLLHLCL